MAVVVLTGFGWLLFFGLMAWALVCNSRTCRDRLGLLDEIETGNRGSLLRGIAAFGRVSYERHMWQRFTLRDWRRLYDEQE